MSFDVFYTARDLDLIANELREAYGLSPNAELWMRPIDLIEWKQQECLQRAFDRLQTWASDTI